MVVFNPQVQPFNPPEWTNTSRPISDLTVDKSKALAIGAAADALDSGVHVAESIDQDIIKNKVRAGVDTLRDATTLAYSNIRDSQVSGSAPDVNAMRAAGFTGSLLNGVGSDVPQGVTDGVNRAQAIGTALAQSNTKANDTLYTGQLNALAKQLRSEYPGHRDFIDEQIARISGKNPANAYMDNLLQDINRNAAVANSGKNKVLNMGYQNIDMPGVVPYIKGVEAGLPGAEDKLMQFLNTNLSKKYQYDEWQRARTARKDVMADDSQEATVQYQQEIQTAFHRNFHAVLEVPGLTSPETMQRLIRDSQEGRIALTPEQHNQLLSAAVAAKNSALDEAKHIYDSRGYATRIRDGKVQMDIATQEAQYYDRMIDAIKNEKYGTLFEMDRRNTALQTQTDNQLLTDPTLGPYNRLLASANKFGGQQYVNYIQGLGLQKGDVLGRYRDFVNNSALIAATPDDLRQDGKVKSMYDHITQLQKEQASGRAVPPKAYDNIIHNVDMITDPKTPPQVKAEVVKYAFAQQNWRLMDAFQMDFVDSNGKQHKGKYGVYDTLTQPGVTDNIWNLKDKTAWNNYKNWAETSFATLYRDELFNLNKISEEKGVNVRVAWDSDNRRFILDDGKGGPLRGTTTVEQNYIKFANESVNRLNSGLYNLSRVQDKEKTDTSAYLLNTMLALGYRPNEKTAGLPQQIMDAIVASKARKDLGTAFEKAKQ